MNEDSSRAKRIRGSSKREILPLRHRLREATSSAILDATEEVLAEGGFAAASLQAIAMRAGIAVGTIYNHFRDRDELFRALFCSRRAQIFAAVDAVLDAHAKEPFAAQVEAFVRSVFEQFDAHRAFFRIAVETEHLRAHCPSAGASSGGGERPMHELWDRCSRVVKIGLEQGALCPEGGDLYPSVLTGIMRGVLVGCTADPAARFSDETQRVVSIFLNGAAARQKPDRRRPSPPVTPPPTATN